MSTIWNLPKVDLLSFSELEEQRPVLLVTSSPAWNSVGHKLNLVIGERIEAVEATTSSWDKCTENLNRDHFEVVYAVGGGLVADMAKYIAVKLGLPLVCLPMSRSLSSRLDSSSSSNLR